VLLLIVMVRPDGLAGAVSGRAVRRLSARVPRGIPGRLARRIPRGRGSADV